ncbi:hypothetical protein ACA910_009099 [Epithemia clementina (nom. ined.)]
MERPSKPNSSLSIKNYRDLVEQRRNLPRTLTNCASIDHSSCDFLKGPKCLGTSDVILEPPFAITGTTASCIERSLDGDLSVSAIGGSGLYMYKWYEGDAGTSGSVIQYSGNTTATTNTLSNMPKGMYTVEVTDAKDTKSSCSPPSALVTLSGCCAVAPKCNPALPSKLGESIEACSVPL